MDFTLQVEKPGHREVAAGVDAAGQVFWLLTTRFLQIHPDPVNLFLFLCYTSFVHYNLKLRFIYDSSDRTQTSQLWSFYTRFLFLTVFLLSSHWAPTNSEAAAGCCVSTLASFLSQPQEGHAAPCLTDAGAEEVARLSAWAAGGLAITMHICHTPGAVLHEDLPSASSRLTDWLGDKFINE